MRRSSRPGLLAPLLAGLVLVSACTPGAAPAEPPPAPTASTTTIPPTPQQAVSSFSSCMLEEGVDLPEIPLDGRSHPQLALAFTAVDGASEQVRRALGVCAGLLVEPGVLSLEDDPDLLELVRAQLLDFTRCMRERGLDFPDPSPSFEGAGLAYPLDEIPYGAPGFDQAAAACQAELGAGG